MKCGIVLFTLGLALSSPIENDQSTKKYPEILTDIPFIENASAMNFEELLITAASHPGLEWLIDKETLAQSGINLTHNHADIIADAFSTTVRTYQWSSKNNNLINNFDLVRASKETWISL